MCLHGCFSRLVLTSETAVHRNAQFKFFDTAEMPYREKKKTVIYTFIVHLPTSLPTFNINKHLFLPAC